MTRLRKFLMSSAVGLALGLLLSLSHPVAAQSGPYTAQIERFWRTISSGGRTFTNISVSGGTITGVTVTASSVSVGDGTVSAPTLNFTSHPTNGFWQTDANHVSLVAGGASAGGFLLYDPSMDSGKSDPTDKKLFGYLNVNNWGTIGGLAIQGRSGSSTPNSAIELQGWINTTQNATYPAVQLTGVAGIEANSANIVAGTSRLVNICSASSSFCTIRLLDMFGAGNWDHRIYGNPVTQTGFGAVSTVGDDLINAITSTSGAPTQWSPAFTWCGSAWNSVGSASQADCFKAENRTLTAAGTTTALWALASSINAGSYNDVFTMTDGGVAALAATGTWGWSGRSTISSPANAQLDFTNNAATAGIGFDLSSDGQVDFRTRGQNNWANIRSGISDSVNLIRLNGALMISATAPTVASGFGSSSAGTVTNATGTLSFLVTVGTNAGGTTGSLTLPSAAHGWACTLQDVNTTTDLTRQSGFTQTTASFTTTVAWTTGDQLVGVCGPF